MSGVTPGTYGNHKQIPTFTVDVRGRLVFAANLDIDLTTSLTVNVNSSERKIELRSDKLHLRSGNKINVELLENNDIVFNLKDNEIISTQKESQFIYGDLTLRNINSKKINSTTASLGDLEIVENVVTSADPYIFLGDSTKPVCLVVKGIPKRDSIEVKTNNLENNQVSSTIGLSTARGNHDSPVALQVGDSIGKIQFNAYSDLNLPGVKSNWANIASIAAEVTSTGSSSDNIATAKIQFLTNIKPDRTFLKAEFDHRGVMSAPIFKPTPFSNEAERDQFISIPEPGMIVYITSLNKAQVYDGSTWSNLN